MFTEFINVMSLPCGDGMARNGISTILIINTLRKKFSNISQRRNRKYETVDVPNCPENIYHMELLQFCISTYFIISILVHVYF